jgi:hypothetical protein
VGRRGGKGIKKGEGKAPGKGRRGPPSKGRIERGGGRGNVASNFQGVVGTASKHGHPGCRAPGTPTFEILSMPLLLPPYPSPPIRFHF